MKIIIIFCTYLIVLSPFAVSTQNAQSKQCPCCTENHRSFDFWLGNWETYTPDGKLAGTNYIIVMQDSCIIQENWTSARSGYTGTSYNWYNSTANNWHQTWIDNQGGSLQLKGQLNENQMILSSEAVPDGKGGTSINRITWTDNGNGTVRQHWEVSSDNGATFSTAFDGLYKPAEKEK
jgi:hypothetical protein